MVWGAITSLFEASRSPSAFISEHILYHEPISISPWWVDLSRKSCQTHRCESMIGCSAWSQHITLTSSQSYSQDQSSNHVDSSVRRNGLKTSSSRKSPSVHGNHRSRRLTRASPSTKASPRNRQRQQSWPRVPRAGQTRASQHQPLAFIGAAPSISDGVKVGLSIAQK